MTAWTSAVAAMTMSLAVAPPSSKPTPLVPGSSSPSSLCPPPWLHPLTTGIPSFIPGLRHLQRRLHQAEATRATTGPATTATTTAATTTTTPPTVPSPQQPTLPQPTTRPTWGGAPGPTSPPAEVDPTALPSRQHRLRPLVYPHRRPPHLAPGRWTKSGTSARRDTPRTSRNRLEQRRERSLTLRILPRCRRRPITAPPTPPKGPA